MGLKTDNLLCYYSAVDNQGVGDFNENATTWKDLSGNNYDGTIYNCTWEDNGLRIPGASNSYVNTPFNTHIAKNITVECVFELYSVHSALSYLVYNAGQGWTMELGTSNQITPSLYLNSSWRNDTRIQVAQLNKRYHFTFTFDGNVIRSYMNGSLINTNTYSGTSIIRTSTDTMKFGNSSTFNGKIFTVRVYDTVLTPNEIIDNFVYDVEKNKRGVIDQEVSKVHIVDTYNIKDEKARLEKIDRYVDGKATAVVNFLNGIQINGGKIYYDSTKDTVYFE